MERPFVKDIEGFVNDFIKSKNGKRVDEILRDANFANADYYFEDLNIFIELKTLEKDLFSDDDLERNERLLDKWISEKIISKADILAIFLRKKELPEACLQEMYQLARRTFQKIIEKANKQLHQTVEKIGNKDSQKILMLCNDGNYLFPHQLLFTLAFSIIKDRKEIDIDCAVYFTVNQTSRLPNSELEWRIWVPAYDETAHENLHPFVNELGKDFNNYYNQKFQIPVIDNKELSSFESGIEVIEKMTYVPKSHIYK